jgi:nicotinamide mononucleotide transporter
MFHLFSVNNIFFTFLGYPMSYLEFVGTIFNILSVWLVTKNNIWTWPVGIIAVILFGLLFYQIQFYSDLIEQIYFLVTGFYGWWLWFRPQEMTSEKELKKVEISYNTRQANIISIVIIVFGSIAAGYGMSKIHLLLPTLFPLPASFPYLDAFTTVMSFVAQMQMAYKKIESWYLWITVDVIGIGLYYVRGVKFVSLLYVIFLVLATKGLLNWLGEFRKKSQLDLSPQRT